VEIRRDDVPDHLAADLAELLIEDPRVAEQGVQVLVDGGTVVLSGMVATEDRRAAIGRVVAERLPDHVVDNRVEVIDVAEPPSMERLR
jgi:BON domain